MPLPMMTRCARGRPRSLHRRSPDRRSPADLLDDPDPFVRSHAAHGLHAMKDPRALEALIKTIDDLLPPPR
jgi:hypothetical protein